MTSPSSLIYELKNVYYRMLKLVEEEDDRTMIAFFMGCKYAAHVAYERICDWECRQEDE